MAKRDKWTSKVRDVLEQVKLFTTLMDANGVRYTVCGAIRREAKNTAAIPVVIEGDAYALIVKLLRKSAEHDVQDSIRFPHQRNPLFWVVLVDQIPFRIYEATDQNYGAQVLFLTGSTLFNIYTASTAKKMGYKLNQKGLWHFTELIAGKTEDQIFDTIGLSYVPPQERNKSNRRR